VANPFQRQLFSLPPISFLSFCPNGNSPLGSLLDPRAHSLWPPASLFAWWVRKVSLFDNACRTCHLSVVVASVVGTSGGDG